MTPINQTIIKYPIANCLQACVASYFDLDLNKVPNFMLFGYEIWWEGFFWFVWSLNYKLLGYIEGLPPINDKYYIASVDFGEKYKFSHAIIYKNGKIVHDPHPDGINENDNIVGYYEIIKRIIK